MRRYLYPLGAPLLIGVWSGAPAQTYLMPAAPEAADQSQIDGGF